MPSNDVPDAEHINLQLDQAMRVFVNSTALVEPTCGIVRLASIFRRSAKRETVGLTIERDRV
ncbi:MAG: hypothetical protein HY782_09720 [Chloroflexi bacterium]|nr:hypothetical protein [Chloroflexota bacterium]